MYDSIPLDARSRYVDGWRVTVDRFPNGSVEAFARPSWFDRRAEPRPKPCRKRPKKGEKVEGKSVDIERAGRRARKRVRLLCLGIGADHLLSVTYRENMLDRERAKQDWARFVRLVHVRYPQWRYVVVTERQERGAIHFHAGVKGFQPVAYLRRCWRAVVGHDGGNIDVQGPKKRWTRPEERAHGKEWHVGKLAGYISKYMTKGLELEPVAWSKRYWASRLEDDRPVREVFWIQAMDGHMLIEEVYELVIGSRAVGVRQYLLPGDDVRYWVQAPPLSGRVGL